MAASPASLLTRDTGMLLEDRAMDCYGSYICKVNPVEVQQVSDCLVELDPIYKDWDKFEVSMRNCFGGRITRDAAVAA
jgi:hypothetical protein